MNMWILTLWVLPGSHASDEICIELYHQAPDAPTLPFPKSTTHRFSWLASFVHELPSLPSEVKIEWLKAHVGFQGNEITDALAKWIYHNTATHPNLIPPPPKGCIASSGIPLTQKLSKKTIRQVLPHHTHTSLHVSSSFNWYSHSNKLDNLPFLWTSATLWIDGYLAHFDMHSYKCFHCSLHHPMDPLSMVSHCPGLWPIQDLFIKSWHSSC